MKTRPSEKKWLNEYSEFLEGSEKTPPIEINAQILGRVHELLNPAWQWVFAKLVAIHLIFGSLSLFLCPQFGINPRETMGLMHYFMRWGDFACMLGCGSIFVGGSALGAVMLFKSEEIYVLRKSAPLQFLALGFISIGAFLCSGADVFTTLSLYWLIGAGAGGLLAFEGSRWIRVLVNPKVMNRTT